MMEQATVKLSPQINQDIEELIKDGQYKSRAEALRDGVRHIINEAKELKK